MAVIFRQQTPNPRQIPAAIYFSFLYKYNTKSVNNIKILSVYAINVKTAIGEHRNNFDAVKSFVSLYSRIALNKAAMLLIIITPKTGVPNKSKNFINKGIIGKNAVIDSVYPVREIAK